MNLNKEFDIKYNNFHSLNFTENFKNNYYSNKCKDYIKELYSYSVEDLKKNIRHHDCDDNKQIFEIYSKDPQHWTIQDKTNFIKFQLYCQYEEIIIEWHCDQADEQEGIPFNDLKNFIELTFIINPTKNRKNHNMIFRRVIKDTWDYFGYEEEKDFLKDFNEIITNSKYRYFNKY